MSANAAALPMISGLWFGNTAIDLHVTTADGTDGMVVVEHRMPYGESPPLHVHRNEDEIFYVIEGAMLLRVGGRDLTLGAGSAALAPKGVPHHFRVISPEGARCLTITRGADFETMLRAASRPAAGPGLPPAAAPTPDQIAALVAHCAENGIDIVGPPLG
jgi:quercetin dioxygenase-like cupin family protein